MLGDCPTFGINVSFDSPERKFSINSSKVNTNFCLSLHNDTTIVICLLIEKKFLSLRPTIKMLTFQINFVSEV